MDGEEGPGAWLLDLAARNPEHFLQGCEARFGLFESRQAKRLQALFQRQVLDDLGAGVVQDLPAL